jgi:hypothetical protein
MSLLSAVETKVKASSLASAAVGVVVALLNDVENDHALLGPVPAPLQVLILIFQPLVLWLTGMIVSKRELDRANDRADEWKVQYTRESEAHGMTRRALERERERMDTTTETGRTVTALLGVLGSRSSFSPERGGT